MNDRVQGRPPEDPGADHYSPSEASRIIGRSEETIRTWIKNGRLEGDSYIPLGSTTPRYRATKKSVHAEAERLGRNATPADVEHVVEMHNAMAIEEVLEAVRGIFAESDERLMAASGQRIAEVLDALMRQREEVVGAVGKQESEVSDRLDSMAEMVRSMIEREQRYQAESLRIQSETLELLKNVREAEQERREHGQAERRSFWRRLFPLT